MPQYFTLDQARKRLPRAAELVRQIQVLYREHERAGKELDEIGRKVTMMGGMIVNREDLLANRARQDATALKLKETVQELSAVGCQLKDLDMGLIDFPSLYREQPVCLCWKLGEADIEFWHGETEGFRGRKPIDDEFVAHHRGDWVD